VKGVDISLAGGWIEVASNVHPPGEVVVSMRPVSVFAKGPGSIPARRAAAYDRSRTHWLPLEPGVLSEATDLMARKRACGGACSTSSTST
jgi:hypothetical protein